MCSIHTENTHSSCCVVCACVCVSVCGFLATLSQLLASSTYDVGVTMGTEPSPLWPGTLHVEIKLPGFLLSARQNILQRLSLFSRGLQVSTVCCDALAYTTIYHADACPSVVPYERTDFHQMQLRKVIPVSISVIFFAKLNVNRSALYFTSALAWTDLARDC